MHVYIKGLFIHGPALMGRDKEWDSFLCIEWSTVNASAGLHYFCTKILCIMANERQFKQP